MHLFALRSQVCPAGHWLRRTQSRDIDASKQRPSSVEQNSPKGQGLVSEQSSAKPILKTHLWVASSQVLRGSCAVQSDSLAHSAPVTHMFGPNEPSSFMGTHFWPILHSASVVHCG